MDFILKLLFDNLSPFLRTLLENLVNSWEESAKETPNTIDDGLVGLLKRLLGM